MVQAALFSSRTPSQCSRGLPWAIRVHLCVTTKLQWKNTSSKYWSLWGYGALRPGDLRRSPALSAPGWCAMDVRLRPPAGSPPEIRPELTGLSGFRFWLSSKSLRILINRTSPYSLSWFVGILGCFLRSSIAVYSIVSIRIV